MATNNPQFLEGMVFNQQKSDARLIKALHKAYQFGESKEFIKGMTVALRILRGDSYNEKTFDLSTQNYERMSDD